MMFTVYNAQFLFQQFGVRFLKDGVQFATKHPSTFVWSTRGLKLPITNMWFNEQGQIKNFDMLPRKWLRKLNCLAPPKHLRLLKEKELTEFNAEDPLSKKVKALEKLTKGLTTPPKIRVRSAPVGMTVMDLLHRRLGHMNEAYLRKIF